jgi:hypothetical protein
MSSCRQYFVFKPALRNPPLHTTPTLVITRVRDYHFIILIFFTYFSRPVRILGSDSSLIEYTFRLSSVVYLTRLICLRCLNVADVVFNDRPKSCASSVGVFFDFVRIFRIWYAVGLPRTLQNLEARYCVSSILFLPMSHYSRIYSGVNQVWHSGNYQSG